jgi:outer membrane receptor protein involved in Fe transport
MLIFRFITHAQRRKASILSALVVLAAPTAAFAQNSVEPGPSTEQAENMSAFQVTDVPIDLQILPTSRPFNSVFGMDDDILDVPRNVTIISKAQMDAINIQDVSEFSKLTSSSYTDSDFGAPANPTIRGQQADVFVNGMRQHVGANGDGMPVDFNLVESVNIVPGPATAVQGASAYVGGFADLITKQPYFDGNHGLVSYTFGSYDTNRYTLDLGGPITPQLAYRLSVSGEDSDGYWDEWTKQTTSVYAALTWRPNEKYQLFVTANAFWADFADYFGINRPTQALISDGQYQTGTNVNNGTQATATDLQNTFNVEGSGNTIAWGPVVPVNYRVITQGPLTHDHGREFNWQAVQTVNVSSAMKVVNNTYLSYTQHDIYSSVGYNEIDDPTQFIDNRTEFLLKSTSGEVNMGLEERLQEVKEYTNFFFEPVNAWDISSQALRNDINYESSQYFASTYGNVAVPGWPGRPATAGIVNNDTNDSELVTVSPYVQGSWKLPANFSIVAGARLDLSHLDDKDPLTPNTEAKLGFGEGSGNLSLVYKVTPTVSTYATFNLSQNYSGDQADGGGFALYSDANGNPTLPRSLFSEVSELGEYGVKTSTDGGKLFITSDVFYQTRQSKPLYSPVIQYRFYGFEISGNYQPNKNFYATFGYSWINGSLPASAGFQLYPTNQIPGGPPDPFTDPAAYPTTGRLRAPGQPLDVANGLVSYSFDNGFGFEANGLLTSPMSADYWGYLRIPMQYEIDASVFYKTKHWEIRATVTNLTNQHNWQPSPAIYALQSINSEAGIEGDVTLTHKF